MMSTEPNTGGQALDEVAGFSDQELLHNGSKEKETNEKQAMLNAQQPPPPTYHKQEDGGFCACWNRNLTVKTFCENSTIRGVAKLNKHWQPVLRILWSVFILTMTALLLVGVVNLILRYTDYATIINTRTEHNSIADFPSVTLCNHHPFGENAHLHWDDKSIISPRSFSKEIRKKMSELVANGSLAQAQQLFKNDKSASYFESIGHEKAALIGHHNTTIVYCLLKLKDGIRVGHNHECGVQISRLQHPQYFNCYTVKVLPEFTKHAISLGIIVRVGSSERSSHVEQSLIQDAFHQAHGVRVVLHEPETYPDPIKHGLNIKAGLYTELSYQVNKWEKADTPNHTCLQDKRKLPQNNVLNKSAHNDENGCYQIGGVVYDYTESLCRQTAFSEVIYDKCKCQSTLYPPTDVAIADEEWPFCQTINFNNLNLSYNRSKCFQEVYESKIINISAQTPAEDCVGMCTEYTYEVHTSMSSWVSVDWQLYWLIRLSESWDALRNNSKDQSAKDHIHEFARMDDANDEYAQERGATKNDTEIPPSIITNETVFFMVTRPDFLTTLKKETLSVTKSALLSQIGGMSSLTIGLTFATLFELLEFIYLLYVRRKKEKQSTSNEIAMPLTPTKV